MKKQSIKVLAFVAVAGTTVSSCTLLKDLEYDVEPCPLEMHGDSVAVTVSITFPEKSINKKASAEITPMLGETALKPVTFMGEKATGNGNVIAYKPGGKYTYTDVVAYKPAFENTELMVTGTVSKAGKVKDEIEPIEICKGTIVTPLLVEKSGQVILADDKFERITPQTTEATINYLKGKSNVRSSEMKDEDITSTQEWLASAETNPKINIKSINVSGYASPEGEVADNSELSDERATSGKETMLKIAEKAKNTKASGEIYSTSGSGEDFPGFEKVLNADTEMDADDKALVLRVIKMNSSPEQREVELRNMRATFTYLDKNIFPLLRRSEIVTSYDLTGFSDEELKNYSVSKPDTLNLEELLFCATLYEDLNEKLRVYQIAEGRYSDDYRPSNNVGAVLYMQNKISEAKSKFEKANGIKDNEISKNNLGAVAIVEGDREKAWNLLNQAGSSSETSYNKGVLNIQDGDYADAVSNLGSDASYNKALAQLLNGNASAAASTIDNSVDKESAQGYYLKAIAAARQDQLNEVVNNLKSAIAKDGSYKAKALKDMEFASYASNAAFTAIVK
jgi:tetratricopeptide (TPR) repeat protein/outer membrane protein OmpA-like peptidoglycan-associated protein